MIRTLKNLAAECRGIAAVEFALIATPLCLLAVGIAQFGLTLSNYIMLTEAVSSGARTFAVSRGSSTPRSSTVTIINSAASSLVTGSISITTRVNGTACIDNPTCATALSAAAGSPASVTATYPCSLVVFGYNFAPGTCTLSSSTTERIE